MGRGYTFRNCLNKSSHNEGKVIARGNSMPKGYVYTRLKNFISRVKMDNLPLVANVPIVLLNPGFLPFGVILKYT